MATIDYMCSVMREAQRGKTIQVRSTVSSAWCDTGQPNWNWAAYEYRVKPVPREFWVVEWATRLQAFDCKQSAEEACKQLAGKSGRVFHVREVLE